MSDKSKESLKTIICDIFHTFGIDSITEKRKILGELYVMAWRIEHKEDAYKKANIIIVEEKEADPRIKNKVYKEKLYQEHS